MKLETAKHYNSEYTHYLIETQGFDVVLVPNTNVELIVPNSGAALHCIDGRYGENEIGVFSVNSSVKERVIINRPISKEGPKFPGGTTGLASLFHGADSVGMNEVAVKLRELGYATGTHGKCGFADLLINQRLRNVKHSTMPDFAYFKQFGITKGKFMRGFTRHHEGFHPTLEGLTHQETAIMFNPFDGTTTPSDTRYFKTDLALAANHFGVSPTRSILLTLEVVRALAPHVNRVELIV